MAVESNESVYKKSNDSGEIVLDLDLEIKNLHFSIGEYYRDLDLDTVPQNVVYPLRLSQKVKKPAPKPDPKPGNSGREANDKPVIPRTFSINFDEDFLALFDNQDRNYTGGLGFDFMRPGEMPICKYTVINFDNLIAHLGGCFDVAPNRGRETLTSGISIGVTGFTADSLNLTRVIYNDRPYASLTYLNFVRNTLKKGASPDNAKSLVTTTFTVGMLGLHPYHWLQSGIHVLNRKVNNGPTPYDPKGWDNQISNGGEPTLNYTFTKKYVGINAAAVFKTKKRDVPLKFQAAYAYRLSAGHFTGFSAEILLRLGIIRSNILFFDTYKFGFASQLAENKKTFELFPFAGLRPIAVLRNNLISGQFRESPHTLKPITEANPVILEWDYGLGCTVNKRFSIYLFLRHRTPEGRASANYPQRIHSWGGIYATWSY